VGLRWLPHVIGQVVVAAMVLVCASDPSRSEAILDELAIPADWEPVETRVYAPDTEDERSVLFPSCPSVARYYLVPAPHACWSAIATRMRSGSTSTTRARMQTAPASTRLVDR
jgi:hypothetical protein